MHRQELNETAARIESRITEAGPFDRTRLQPELNLILKRMEADGVRVPRRLRQLDEILTEELIEDQFDNMPV